MCLKMIEKEKIIIKIKPINHRISLAVYCTYVGTWKRGTFAEWDLAKSRPINHN